MSKFSGIFLAWALSAAPLGVTSADLADASLAEPSSPKIWRFRVMLDQRDIGTHEFTVSNHEGKRYIEIDADFDVKILFVNAYSYDHENREIWEGDCLASIRAETDDNGKRSRVVGEAVTDGFTVVTDEGAPQTASAACLRSFAYWNPAFLDSRRLLNAQTGEVVDVEVTDRGEETLEIDGTPVPAQRYSLELEEGPIELWYARENGQWLALEAAAKGGRTLRYEPVHLPFGLPGQDRRLATN